jgi:PAS domain S-box-containing protein
LAIAPTSAGLYSSLPPLWQRVSSLCALLASLGFLFSSALVSPNYGQFNKVLLPGLFVAMAFAVFLTSYSLWNLSAQHQGSDRAFRNADCEFSSIFQNVLDGILIVDNEGDCLDANPAATAILRVPLNKLIGQNIGRFLADGRVFTQRWSAFLETRSQRGRTQLVAGDGTTLFVDFTATANYLPGRHILILCDVTERTQAELSLRRSEERFQLMASNIQEAARAEAEALRKSTFALSQNLAMDSVLDTLLHCISELVPFDRATILFVEDGFELMVAREAPRITPKRIGLTLKASENVFLEQVLFEKRAILIPNVAGETEWQDTPPLDQLQSWLGIPLVAAGRVLGILSLGSSAPCAFTTEHLRLAKTLAIPAAVAIQNARIHERAEIYAAELEVRLRELRETREALEHVGKRSRRSDKI